MENKIPPTDTKTVAEPLSPVTKPPFHLSKTVIALLITLAVVLTIVGFLLLRRLVTTPTQENLSDSSAAYSPAPITLQVDTTDWLTYTDNEAGFTFKYPRSVLINEETKNSTELVMSVSSEKLSDIPEDLPLSMGRQDALKQKSDLVQMDGTNIRKVGDLNGQVSTIYSQFEVCSVIFSKKFTFYPGEYRVILTLSGPKEKIMSEMPGFFTVDPANCGTNLMWNQENKSDFETTLANLQGIGIAQNWYNYFYLIVNTLQLLTPSPQ